MNTRRHLFLAAGLAAILCAPSFAATTGSGTPATEMRQVSDFQAILLEGSMDLVVRQGTREAVEVRADDNLLPLIATAVEEGAAGRTLRIGVKRGESIRSRTPIVVTVDLLRLTALASSGSGNVVVEALKTPRLALSISGSSDLRAKALSADELSLSIAGSGDVLLAGKTTGFKVSIAGSGSLRAHELAADEVRVSIAGSGDAQVNANKTLSVSIAGSGDVEYSGNPSVKRSVVGSGNVTRK